MPELLHDGPLWISEGEAQNDTYWKNRELNWSVLVNLLKKTKVTSETLDQYLKLHKDRQGKIKDIGGFVGGVINGGNRLIRNITSRDLLTLDVDDAVIGFWLDFQLSFDCAAVLHSTHKHAPSVPRYRLIIPLSREMHCDEYEAMSRKVAEILGILNFCPSSFRINQMMYWPSTPTGSTYQFEFQDGEWLNPDYILGLYADWKDMSQWTRHPKEKKAQKAGLAKQGDPYIKPEPIGLFCRTYSIQEAIEAFLGDVYIKCDNSDDRYSYAGGSTSGGLVIYEDKFAYSHHATDPIGGMTCNAYDLVRIHLFGSRDARVHPNTPFEKYPSQGAMQQFASGDRNVVLLKGIEAFGGKPSDLTKISREAVLGSGSSDEKKVANTDAPKDWLSEMDVDKRMNYQTTVKNIRLILQNDPAFSGKIAFDELSQKLMVLKKLPWDKIYTGSRPWSDTDWGALRCFLGERPYNLAKSNKLEDVMCVIRLDSSYHPIRQYIKELVWDKQSRLETLLIDYFGADDNPYNRTVTRKTLVAAVTRVFRPGAKFDHVLTLVGDERIGKSTLISKLGRQWYSDTFNFNMLHTKQAYEQLQGFWLIEMGEMAGLKKAEVELAKSFISSPEDTYRPAYGRETVSLKRQCIFIGTTNNFDFLRRANGNRRFWPVDLQVQASLFNVWDDLTEMEVDQIWAEAYQCYLQKEPINLSSEIELLAKAIQQEHEEVDDQKGMIQEYLNTLLPDKWEEKTLAERVSYFAYRDEESAPGIRPRTRVSAPEIWCECFKKLKGDLGTHNSKYIHSLMREMPGWIQHKNKIKFSAYGDLLGYVTKEDDLLMRVAGANIDRQLNDVASDL